MEIKDSLGNLKRSLLFHTKVSIFFTVSWVAPSHLQQVQWQLATHPGYEGGALKLVANVNHAFQGCQQTFFKWGDFTLWAVFIMEKADY